MKGIILAGGSGSRLYPLSQVASKQLQAVYDKPMVYYPVVTLMENGVREFCLISTPRDLPRFEALLGDGSQWGISIEYLSQPKPEGIAQAFIIAERFIDGGPVTLILGDNIFYGPETLAKAYENFNGGAIVFAYQVNNPERYGVVEFDVLARARPGSTVKLGPNDQICQIRRITAEDVSAINAFKKAYISRNTDYDDENFFCKA